MKKFILVFFVFQISAVNISLAQYTKLLNFEDLANGRNPYGALINDGTFLYGMTQSGGSSGMGTIFKIKLDGTSYEKLLDFTGTTNGSNPYGTLISDGTFIYGMTKKGGTNDLGTIFKIKSDGTNFLKLLDFAGVTNGSYPHGTLYSDGIFLYGMTAEGGTNDNGIIFKVMTDGTGFAKLLDFAGTTNGSNPFGSLISDGTFLYGMTKNGGENNLGTIFKIMPDGTSFEKILNFAGTENGSNPNESLIFDGTYLYGITRDGGTNDRGTIFKIKPDGTNYENFVTSDFTLDWCSPVGSLVSVGTFLYGMTSGCGNGYGSIFKVKPDGTEFKILLDFDGVTNGSSPNSSLISDGDFLYGMTALGGTNYLGVVFKYCIPTATATNTGPYCAGSTIQLNSTGGSSYSWSGPLSYTNPTQNPILASSTIGMSGTYTITATNSNGCSSSVSTVVIVDACLNTLEIYANKINVYPNPTTGILNLSPTVNGLQFVSITNILGEVILKKEINLIEGTPISFDISNQPAGIYLLKFDNSIQKIIKQ